MVKVAPVSLRLAAVQPDAVFCSSAMVRVEVPVFRFSPGRSNEAEPLLNTSSILWFSAVFAPVSA
ncbi:MAG TPA: hypothetical protein ENH91_15960 [Leeuwenhoekiella sp.]|nr:hypothetical protein [Leeuwenhoekiella sp.]